MNQNRPEYYDALYYGQHSGDSSRFMEFTLSALLEVLQKTNADLLAAEQVTEQDDAQVTEQVDRAEKIIEFCAEPKSREEIQLFVGIAHREHFRAKILKPLLDSGKLKMTIPDKPNSRNQKYVKA